MRGFRPLHSSSLSRLCEKKDVLGEFVDHCLHVIHLDGHNIGFLLIFQNMIEDIENIFGKLHTHARSILLSSLAIITCPSLDRSLVQRVGHSFLHWSLAQCQIQKSAFLDT